MPDITGAYMQILFYINFGIFLANEVMEESRGKNEVKSSEVAKVSSKLGLWLVATTKRGALRFDTVLLFREKNL